VWFVSAAAADYDGDGAVRIGLVISRRRETRNVDIAGAAQQNQCQVRGRTMTLSASFHCRLAAHFAMASGVAACLSSENIDLGRNIDGGTPAIVSPDLDAAVVPDSAASILTTTIAAAGVMMGGSICQGACVQIVAIATGAPGPYTYAWGQGLGEGQGPKTVCPVATTTYSVTVSAMASAQQSTGSATITVLPCDAGSTPIPPPPVDAGGPKPPVDSGATPSPSAALCITDPSFEGTPAIGTSGAPGIPATAAPPGWQVCLGDPDIDPIVSLLPASQGKTYVGMTVGSPTFAGTTAESLGTTLCAPLKAGTRYSFCVDVAIGVQGVMLPAPVQGQPGPALEFWGGKAACGQDELLWTTQAITNRDAWTTVCCAFVPSQNLSTLSLIPTQAVGSGPATLSYVIVDNFVPGP
jgi:hypothetical protein